MNFPLRKRVSQWGIKVAIEIQECKESNFGQVQKQDPFPFVLRPVEFAKDFGLSFKKLSEP